MKERQKLGSTRKTASEFCISSNLRNLEFSMAVEWVLQIPCLKKIQSDLNFYFQIFYSDIEPYFLSPIYVDSTSIKSGLFFPCLNIKAKNHYS